MSTAPIYFQFPDKRSALLALDTLQEIGFEADMLEHRHPEHKPTLQVNVDKTDLTSALEIAQAHGGYLYHSETMTEPEVYTSAYGLDGIPIPAHTVTEDLPESYLENAAYGNEEEAREHPFDPSDDDYNGFPAGVRL